MPIDVEGGRFYSFHCNAIVLQLFISHDASFDIFMNGSLFLPITNKNVRIVSAVAFKEKKQLCSKCLCLNYI